MRFAIVQWLDAWAIQTAEATKDNVHEDHKPALMETAGWILRDDEVGISTFAERSPDDNSYRGRTFIPRGMIVSVQDITGLRPRRKRVKKAADDVANPA